MEAVDTPLIDALTSPEPSGVDDVRALFNEKAAEWQRKYAPGGPLVRRLTQFESALAAHVTQGGHVLDLGCGTGNLAAHLSRTYAVQAVDIAERMLSVARVHFARAAVRWHLLDPAWTRLPLVEGSVDAVVSSSVFEYLPEVSAVLAECHRLLRPGGWLIVTVPNPRTPVRRFEASVRRLARVVPGGLLSPRLRGYRRYLELSRNRWPLAQWRALFDAAGFEVVGGVLPPTSLVLFALCKR
jgi:ubiquinone/menaquinone biosynthesis C-methylase UbiE